MPFTWKLHIDAPPEVVFDALADVANHGAWANPNAKLQIHEVSGGPPALGSKYRSEQVFVGKPNTADIEITAFDRPRRFAYSVSQRKDGAQKDVHLTHTFTLTPEGGGTSLQRSTDGDGTRCSASSRSPRSRPTARSRSATSRRWWRGAPSPDPLLGCGYPRGHAEARRRVLVRLQG